MTDVIAVSAGGVHSLAVRIDGAIWAWGNNFWGQLGDGFQVDRGDGGDGGDGDGTRIERRKPVTVNRMRNVAAASGGESFSLGLKTNGHVWPGVST